MTLSISIPDRLAEMLRHHIDGDLGAYALEALAVQLYRERKLYHKQLAEILGLDRWQTDEVLRRHGVVDLTPEEIDRQFVAIRNLERS